MASLQERLNAAKLQTRLDKAQLEAGAFDQKTGAPAKVRMLVDSARTPDDKLSTLRKHYPDARPFIEGNFIFNSPETGKPTLYNPGGLDLGDVAGAARMGAEVIGGIGGTLGGTAVAPGPGSVIGAGAGSAAGGEFFDRAIAKPLGMEDTRSIGSQIGDAAITFGLGAAGQKGGEVVGKYGKEAAKRVFGGGAGAAEKIGRNIADYNLFGGSPSVAQATQRAWIDSFESFMSKMPGGSGQFRKFANNTIDNIQKSVDARSAALAGRSVDPEIAGRSIRKGVTNWVNDTFKVKGGALYDELDKFVGPDVPVSYNNTQSALAQLADPVPGNPGASQILAHPQVRKLMEAFGDGQEMTYGVLKQLRSAIGGKLSSPSLLDDAPRAQLKQIYGAISNDMRDAAKLNGGDSAVKAWERADKYWRAGLGRIDDFLEKFTSKVEPESIIKLLESRAKNGGTMIRAVTRSLGPEEKRVLAATVMKRLGRAKGGAQDETGELFSLDTFLTNWSNMTPSAKSALFQGRDLDGVYDGLEALARVAARTRESARVFQNPSGTAGQLIGQTMMMGGGVGGAGLMFGVEGGLTFLAGLGSVAVGANGAARLLTSPKFVKWLAASSKVKPNGVGAHLGRLSSVSAGEDIEMRNTIKSYVRGLSEGVNGGQVSPSIQ